MSYNYVAMLDRLDWTLRNNDLVSLTNIFKSVRKLSINNVLPKDSIYSFWQDVVDRNIYIAALFYKKAEKLYGEKDEYVQAGATEISAELKKLIFEEGISWRLLAEIEMNSISYMKQYTEYAVEQDTLKKSLKYLQYSNNISENTIFYLYSVISSNVQLTRNVVQCVTAQEWCIDINALTNTFKLTKIIESLVKWNDIPSLINLSYLSKEFDYLAFSQMSRGEWKEYLLMQYQPMSMMLYRKILKRANVSMEDIMNDLYSFTAWQRNEEPFIINNYLYFAYAIEAFPEKYDYYASFFTEASRHTQLTYLNIGETLSDFNLSEDLSGLMSEGSKRYFNYLITDEPFWNLILHNPDKIPHFLSIIGELSLYHESKSLQYKKNRTWVKTIGNYLNDYKNYTEYIADKYEPDEVIRIYINSPLKNMVDFSYLIRRLFMPIEGYKDLSKELEKYTFRGKLIKNSQTDAKIAYQVSISNVHSSYRFPIHHSWTSSHFNELGKKYTENDTVYFKIMSINHKGMIFAHDLSVKPPVEKKEESRNKVKSIVLKNIEKIKDCSLSLQGCNTEEIVRLYALAMIIDPEGRILVESKNRNAQSIEYLPCLPISNLESSDVTIKRLLRYFVGFNSEICLTPCAIRHLCNGYDKRSIFFIYKILLKNLQEIQSTLVIKNSMNWREVEEYRENIEDDISASFIDALEIDWSEYILSV